MALGKQSGKEVRNVTALVKNATHVAKGKVKTAAGKATGNKKLEVKGQFETVNAKAKRAGQRLKEALD